MKQTMKEIETRIRKQIGEDSKFVVLDKTKDNRIVNVSIGEWVKTTIVDELEQQADITKRELAKTQQRKEDDLLEYIKTNFVRFNEILNRQEIINAFTLMEIDLIKGVIDYPEDYDKLVAWFGDYLTNGNTIYDSELLQSYIVKVRGE